MFTKLAIERGPHLVNMCPKMGNSSKHGRLNREIDQIDQLIEFEGFFSPSRETQIDFP